MLPALLTTLGISTPVVVGGGLALGGLLIQGMKSKIRVFGKEITMGEGLLYSGGAYALYAYYNSSQEQKNQQEFNNKYGTDKSAQQANALLVAMNPSGDTWFRSLDGTNEEAIFKIASEITDWAKVQSYFKTLTGFELADALGAELSGEEIDRFHRLLNKQEAYSGTGSGSGSGYTLTRGQTVYVRQNMNVEVYIYLTQKTTSIVAAKNTPVRVDDFVFRNGKKLVVYKVQKSTVFNGQDVAYIFAPEMLSPARVSGIGYIVNSQCATTECADGTFSTSTHPNACSHHGGIKNRVQKPSTPTPAAYNPAEVYFVPLNKIFTAEHLFQNRKESHSQESANRIIKAVETGSFKWQVFDPVLLWQNPADNKLYILSGHSRTAAFRILAQQKAQADGKDFTSIPAKIIRTTEAEAREIALNSNTLATKENDTERAAYYRNLRESGKDMREIYALAKDNEGRNANAIMAYSCLNPDGKAFQSLLALETADLTSRKIAETVAIWLGSARSKFGLLTNQHENELYDWLIMGAYGNKPGQISNQNDFLGRVQATIDKRSTFGNFEADKPLNIRNIQTQSSYDLELDQVRQEIAQAQKTLTEKRREFIQRGATGTALENVLKPYQDGVNYYSQKLIKMQQDKGNIKQHERAQLEMFGFKNRR